MVSRSRDEVSRRAIRSMSLVESIEGPIGRLYRSSLEDSSETVSAVTKLINLKLKAGN